MDKYVELVEYLKSVYSDLWNEKDEKIDKTFDEFNIRLTRLKSINQRFVFECRVESEKSNKSWEFIIGSSAILYASTFEKYRTDLVNTGRVKGIFTLKDTFFKYSSIPTAVIVLGVPGDSIWLTTATNSSDVVSLMSDIQGYARKVFFTKTLASSNFTPEYYNEERVKLEAELSKCETKELQEIAEIINGKNTPQQQLSDEGIAYLRGRNIQDGRIVDVKNFISFDYAEEYSKQLLEEGDIILQKQFGYHKFARVTLNDLPAIASSGLFIIRAYAVPDDYLYAYLNSDTGKEVFEKQLSSIERGTTIVSINLSDLRKLRVPIFDRNRMELFVNIENEKIENFVQKTSLQRLYSYFQAIQGSCNEGVKEETIKALSSAGWEKKNIRLARECDTDAFESGYDILLYDDKQLIAGMIIKGSLYQITKEWIEQAKKLIGDKSIPISILTLGNYYEIHVTKTEKIIKQDFAPTKDFLLSLINGKEAN